LHQDSHDIRLVTKDVLFALHIFPHQTLDVLVVKQSLERVQEANLEFSFKKRICQ